VSNETNTATLECNHTEPTSIANEPEPKTKKLIKIYTNPNSLEPSLSIDKPKQKMIELVNKIFKPNEKGISKWLTREEIESGGIKFTGNGETRQGIFKGVNQYIWKYKRMNDTNTGKIVKIKMNGINLDKNLNRSQIRQDIRDYYKDKSCVFCGTKQTIPDHKNDLYNDPRVLNKETQNIDDFQPLCNACNLRKRQVCKNSKKTGNRFGATNIPSLKVFKIDFIQGNEKFNIEDINAMVGTFWYDPVKFMCHINSRSASILS
jgi:5-methylcytosine-specific restriction endonuclease McrA